MDKKRHIAIFTTASLPWMTGTAVNPLFRAAYLSRDGERNVTLVIPWLSLKDQELVYPNNITFESPSEQDSYVRQWVEDRTGFESNFSIKFYPGKFSRDKGSILGAGDISEIISDEDSDVAVLEEPEHLTWYHHGKRWKTKFRLVIGIVHTNYLEYVRREKNGKVQAFLLKYLNNWVVGIYCHKVIRLSAATQDYPKSLICNVHGVNPKFLEIGKRKLEQQQNGEQAFNKGAYYIGKMIWSKGYKELLNLLSDHENELTELKVDLYGTGDDSEEVKQAAKKLKLTVRVNPGRDHADPIFHDYKVFLNPSTTDVVCTTTAEALAMGKLVVCADHPSNEFFKQFPNCRTYKIDDDGSDFVSVTLRALSDEPSPPTEEQRHELSWESATERFLKIAELEIGAPKNVEAAPISVASKKFLSMSLSMQRNIEDISAKAHHFISGFEAPRKIFGAVPGSLQPDEEQRKELGLGNSMPSGT